MDMKLKSIDHMIMIGQRIKSPAFLLSMIHDGGDVHKYFSFSEFFMRFDSQKDKEAVIREMAKVGWSSFGDVLIDLLASDPVNVHDLTDGRWMFCGCDRLKEFDFDTPNLTSSFKMFYNQNL